MSASTLPKLYERLSAEERFKLILSASARGDAQERDRLVGSSKAIELRMRDYTPWAEAFTQLAFVTYMELMDAAVSQQDAFHQWREASRKAKDAAGEVAEAEEKPPSSDEATARRELSADEKFEMLTFDTYLANGFLFKTKVAGWKLFCERMSVPAFTIWESLPGYDRFQAAMKRIKHTKARMGAAFHPKGMLRFLQEIRRAGQAEPTIDWLISPENYADEQDKLFRDLVKQHGG
ncbi:MAG TPA: hypothetical protein VMF30_05955 [Pirellulales bacterium]|nr:hypothetical protein [Pirellulales bacterium]